MATTTDLTFAVYLLEHNGQRASNTTDQPSWEIVCLVHGFTSWKAALQCALARIQREVCRH
jgi:hypothetical protein